MTDPDPDKLRALADECALGITYHGRSGPVDEAHAADRLRQATIALRACAKRLEVDRWQPISTAPAIEDMPLLLATKSGEVDFGYYDSYTGLWGGVGLRPTHWRLPPAPPKGDHNDR